MTEKYSNKTVSGTLIEQSICKVSLIHEFWSTIQILENDACNPSIDIVKSYYWCKYTVL